MEPSRAKRARDSDYAEFEIDAETDIDAFLQRVSGIRESLKLTIKTDLFFQQLATLKNRVTGLIFDGTQIPYAHGKPWPTTEKLSLLVRNNCMTLRAIHLKDVEIKKRDMDRLDKVTEKPFLPLLVDCTSLEALRIDDCFVDNFHRHRQYCSDPEGYRNYPVEEFFADLAAASSRLVSLSLDGNISLDRKNPYHHPNVDRAAESRSDGDHLISLLQRASSLTQISLRNFAISGKLARQILTLPHLQLSRTDCHHDQEAVKLLSQPVGKNV